MLVVDPAFLCLLPLREAGQRPRWNLSLDDRARCNPSIVANDDRSIERIVDTGPDVAADPGLRLRAARLVLEVRGDVPGSDVRVVADLRVADVGEVRHLGACADRRGLDLDEGADLRALADDGPRPYVGEVPDLRPRRAPGGAP